MGCKWADDVAGMEGGGWDFACGHSGSFSARDAVNSLTSLSCSDTWRMFQRQWDVGNY